MQRFLWILSLLALLLTFGSMGGAKAQTPYSPGQTEALTQPRLVVFEEFFRST